MTEEYTESTEQFEQSVEQTAPVDGGQQQSGVMDQVAVGHVEQQEPAYEQPSQQDVNWKQANEALAQMKEEKARLAGELEALKSMVAQPRQEQPRSYFDGRERDEHPNISDLEIYVNNVVGQKSKEVKQQLEQVQLKGMDPNYKQTIEKYSKHLPQSLKEQIAMSETPWLTAYEAVTSSAAYYRDQISQQQHPNAQKIAENQRKPKTLSGVSQASSLSEASRYEAMSDEEIIAMGNKYANGGR